MKTKINISITVLTLAISACIAPSALSESHCEGKQPDEVVTLNHGPSRLILAPDTVDVCPDQTIAIVIAPPAPVNTIWTQDVPVAADSAWLRESNQTVNRLEIKVPPTQAEKVYKYKIMVPGVGELDPRVRVKK